MALPCGLQIIVHESRLFVSGRPARFGGQPVGTCIVAQRVVNMDAYSPLYSAPAVFGPPSSRGFFFAQIHVTQLQDATAPFGSNTEIFPHFLKKSAILPSRRASYASDKRNTNAVSSVSPCWLHHPPLSRGFSFILSERAGIRLY